MSLESYRTGGEGTTPESARKRAEKNLKGKLNKLGIDEHDSRVRYLKYYEDKTDDVYSCDIIMRYDMEAPTSKRNIISAEQLQYEKRLFSRIPNKPQDGNTTCCHMIPYPLNGAAEVLHMYAAHNANMSKKEIKKIIKELEKTLDVPAFLECIKNIPESNERKAFIMRYKDGMSSKQIAENLRTGKKGKIPCERTGRKTCERAIWYLRLWMNERKYMIPVKADIQEWRDKGCPRTSEYFLEDLSKIPTNRISVHELEIYPKESIKALQLFEDLEIKTAADLLTYTFEEIAEASSKQTASAIDTALSATGRYLKREHKTGGLKYL